MSIKIFLSSNRNEFIEERLFIKKSLIEDSLLKNWINVFLFEEDVESSSFPPKEVYISEVRNSDIYIGLLGYTYGRLTEEGISATELEYIEYKKIKSDYFFYVKKMNKREKKMNEFIKRIQQETTYTTFNSKEELLTEIKKTIISYMNKRLSSVPFDESIIKNTSLNDVDIKSYETYLDFLSNQGLKSLKKYRKKSEILQYLHAGVLMGTTFHLTNAGVLFFSNNIEKYNIEHEIKMVRFEGKDRLTIIDYQESHAPIPILLEEIEKFFRRNTRHGTIVKGFEGVSIPEYPFEAIREAIVNAIAHRDYTIPGDTITFYIYSDRIEIISPGRSLVPLEDLGKVSPIHRNETLCNIFRYTSFMEHVGTGIFRMKRAMDEEGLRQPEFYNFTNNFRVTFWGRKGTEELPKELNDDDFLDLRKIGLKNRQIKALELILNQSQKLNAKSYSNMFNVSQPTASRDLNDMVQKNLITKEKEGKTTYFMKIS